MASETAARVAVASSAELSESESDDLPRHSTPRLSSQPDATLIGFEAMSDPELASLVSRRLRLGFEKADALQVFADPVNVVSEQVAFAFLSQTLTKQW